MFDATTTIDEVLAEDRPGAASAAVRRSGWEPAVGHAPDLVPSSPRLAQREHQLATDPIGAQDRLRVALDGLDDRYDDIIIDCPPSLGILTMNAMVAAQSLLVPLQCEFFALEGLSQLLNTVERVRAGYNQRLNIIGVVLTMYDKRNRLSEQVAADVRAVLGKIVFETIIPRNVRLSEAPSHGLPALVYDHRCAGSEAYIDLSRELLGRTEPHARAA